MMDMMMINYIIQIKEKEAKNVKLIFLLQTIQEKQKLIFLNAK